MEPLDIDKVIGRNLKRLRSEKKISQEQLALKINTPWTRLSAYETGREGMGKDIMSRICKVLEVEPWEFYITDSTPIVKDEREADQLKLYRQAERLGIADQVREQEEIWIERAKKKERAAAEDAVSRPHRIRKKAG